MSHRTSRERSSRRSQHTTAYPTAWSEWEWNDDYECDVRFRLKAPDDYEYEYGPQNASTPRDTSSISNLGTIPEQPSSSEATQEHNYTITPSDIGTLERAFANTSLRPSSSQHPQAQEYTPQSSGYHNHITTRNPQTSFEKFDPHYKVHKGHEFQWGKVFKVLWAEPPGNTGSTAGDSEWSERSGKYGQKVHEKVRRFVIIDRRDGHCICLPIMTYGGQGTNKFGVHAKDHAIIWTEKPVWFKGEYEKGLTKHAIRMEPSSKRHKLDEASRLNYAKLYTVEYNVKVWFIGTIHLTSEYQLTADYNLVHPPMPPRGAPPSSGDTYAYAGGGTEVYQAPYSAYAASGAPYTASDTAFPATSSTSGYQSSQYAPLTTPYANTQVASSYQMIGYNASQASSYQTPGYETSQTSPYRQDDHDHDYDQASSSGYRDRYNDQR